MRFVGIDPATKTGFVALDEQGNVLVETEVIGSGKKMKGGLTTEQLVSLENQVYKLLKPGDIIAIEQPAMGTQSGVTTGMIHGGLRSMIYRKGLDFIDVNPQRTKKFVNVGRVPSKVKKKAMEAAALDHFGYEHPSDNVTDAYIIARIAEAVYRVRKGLRALASYMIYQGEVITAIADPTTAKKPKPKSNKRPGKPAAAGSHTHSTEQQFLF
ncbi:hypothetical protein [Paenibacillus cineris]|uniref:Uncharacterized protein n=1 Tax=Paenibacillus cineris TaxID=237530 RepID=A0ABQ4LPL6_9BACL|nr:hypothetical protein [Paenibacillus cineris]GIO57973.1 hypothetical protein J21TS7_62910 [Paenibacillus cineris]